MMKIVLSTIGRRGYLADYFRDVSPKNIQVIGTTDRHGIDSELTAGLLNCDTRYLVPSIDTPGYVDVLLDLCEQERVQLICSLFDQDCHVLSDHLDKFREAGVLPFLPDRRTSDICFDKVLTDQFLRGIGVGSPPTFKNVDALRTAGQRFPVVIKPRFGFASQNLFIVNNERQLSGCFDPNEHIVQAFVPGEEYSFDILNDLDGKVLSCVIKRKIKMRAGETDQAITVKDKKLLDLAVYLGESLGHVGPLDVDLFVSGSDVSILEFNPRFGGGYPLAHAAGARFPELMVDMANGRKPKPIIGEYREDIVMVKDILSITMPLCNTGNGLRFIGRESRCQTADHSSSGETQN